MNFFANGSGFCPDSLWDPAVSWNTDNPNLTECARQTLMSALPSLTLVLLMPSWLNYFKKARRHAAFPDYVNPPSNAFWAKMVVGQLCMVGVVLRFMHDTSMSEDAYKSDYLLLASSFGGIIAALALAAAEMYVGAANLSATLVTFWHVRTILSLPFAKDDLQVMFEEQKGGQIWFLASTAILSFPTNLICAILHSFAGEPRRSSSRSPAESASFLSRLTFSWLNPLISIGFKRILEKTDVPQTPTYLEASSDASEFNAAWDGEKEKRANVSIWKVLVRLHWKRCLASTTLYAVNMATVFVDPQLLRLIIRHVQNEESETWKGVFYALVLLTSFLGYTFTFGHAVHQLTIVAFKMRNGISSALLRKSLKLSADSRKEHNSGEITTLISVDCESVLHSFPYVHHLWSDPLAVAITMYFLYEELGASSFAGVAFLAVLAPVNTYAGKVVKGYQERVLKFKDERMKVTNETLSGMLALKLLAWEQYFAQMITDIRDREINTLKKMGPIYALSNIVFTSSPIFVSTIVFSTYVVVDPANNILTTEKIFVSIALFNLLRGPLELFPIVLFDCIRLYVSAGRAEKALNAEELDPNAVRKVEESDFAVEIKDGSYAWGKQDELALKNVDLEIPRGSLVAVVGRVGSGKTTLLSAITGKSPSSLSMHHFNSFFWQENVKRDRAA